jgi:hypothetical protein
VTTGAAATVGLGEVSDALHDLNNVLVSIRFNALVIGWKLPSSSRIKRKVHEGERSAAEYS